jgi:beta-glucanase (GH16 family)
MNSVFGRFAELLQKTHRKSKKTASKKRTVSRLRGYALGAVRVTGAVAVGLAFLMLSTGIRPSLPFGSSQKTEAIAQPKTKVVRRAPVKVCAAPQGENAHFAKCADFFVDYRQPNQKPLSDIFNIHDNVPTVNNEAQRYTNSSKNIRVEDGRLALIALNEQKDGFSYTSARIDTRGKEDFLYGRLVVRATLPRAVGTWPAIWMLPSESRYAKLSPASDYRRHLNDGEIDIAESIGTYPNLIYAVTHARSYTRQGVDHTYFDTIKVPGSHVDYHDYSVDWTPTKITMSVDGKPYFSYKKAPGADYRSWPFDQPFYLVINLALGGNWAGKKGIDNSALPATMQIESIRYYSYTGQR